jgi:hypothetical protein
MRRFVLTWPRYLGSGSRENPSGCAQGLAPTADAFGVAERVRLKLLHPAIGLAALPLREGETLVFGRGGADVDLGWDTQVSRRHARVGLRGGHVYVEDLSSRNGTWIGRARLHGPRALDMGEEVLIGDTVLRVAPANEADPFCEVTDAELDGYAEDLGFGAPPDATSATRDLRQTTADLRVVSDDLDVWPATSAPGVALPRSSFPSAFAPSTPGFAPPPPRVGSIASAGVVPVSPAPPRRLSPVPPAPTSNPAIAAVPSSTATATATPAPPPPMPVAAQTAPIRVELSGAELGLTYTTDAAFRNAYRTELSRGTVVVPTASRRPIGARLHVILRQPAGGLRFEAQVLAELPMGSMGLAAGGLALQVLGLERDTLRQLAGLEPEPGFAALVRALERSASQPTVDALYERARALIAAMERGDFYGALEVPPDAPEDTIRAKLQAALQALAIPAGAPETPQLARVRAAEERLERLSQALLDPMRRLEHDFRHGYVRAMDRIARARLGVGPSLEVLRRVWHQVHPLKVDRAAFLTRKAFAASQAGDFETAVRAGRGALEENPFFDELRPTVEGWERARARGAHR